MAEEQCQDLNNSIAPFAEPIASENSLDILKGPNSVKHMYIEEQNVYGRFIPYLLLKDQLPVQIDSSGNSALSHMCSHNSPYLPLYLSTLKKYDPILNRPNKMGHTPLDIAAVFCRRQYVQMLRDKGAVDEGRVDYWAIQGGNIVNWSGQVDLEKHQLIHWAAYNDFPDVLREYCKHGADMNQIDGNGLTPVDLAIINKSYQSVRVLANFGCKPKPKLLQQTQSSSIHRIFNEQRQSRSLLKYYTIQKCCFVPFVFILCWILQTDLMSLIIGMLALIIWFILIVLVNQSDNFGRDNSFHSDLVLKKMAQPFHHLAYILMLILLISLGFFSLYYAKVQTYGQAIIFWVLLVICISLFINIATMIYGICVNRTQLELFQAHKCPYLYDKFNYIPFRKIVIRKYSNPYDQGIWKNILNYYS